MEVMNANDSQNLWCHSAVNYTSYSKFYMTSAALLKRNATWRNSYLKFATIVQLCIYKLKYDECRKTYLLKLTKLSY
jgi:hypothetical protein